MDEKQLKAIYQRWELKNNPMKAKHRAMKEHNQTMPSSHRAGTGSGSRNDLNGLIPLTAVFPNRGFYNRR